jgi:transcription antitermination protein NusB
VVSDFAPMSKDFSKRKEGRVAAVRYLFSWSLNQPVSQAEDLTFFFQKVEEESHLAREHYAFGEELIHGVIAHKDEVDERIRGLARNWDFERIAKMDLAILRVAIFEMLFRKDIPPVVSINEAIEISKQFSSEDSKRFINGILDKLKEQISRPSRTIEE